MSFKRFLSKTAVAAAVIAMAGAAGAAENSLAADVVVVGGGAAGMAAATASVDAGLKTVLLEKNAFVGGGAALAEGLFGAQTEWQRLRNYSLPVDYAYDRIMNFTHYKANGALVKRFLRGSAGNLDWLAAHGMKFNLTQMSTTELISWHVVGPYKGTEHGAAYIQLLNDYVLAHGGKIYTNTPAKSLIKEGGRVVGVKAADNKGNTYTIRAKAVVIASGGYGNSPEKLRDWAHVNPKLVQPTAPLNKTGDGIVMAREAGAAPGPVGLMLHPGTEGKGIKFLGDLYSLTWAPRSMWVNADGNRFVRETVVHEFSDTGNALIAQRGEYAWAIFDENQVKFYETKGIDNGVGVLIPTGKKLTNLRKEMAEADAANSDGFKSAATLDELAAKIGVPEKNFKAAVEQYNKACEVGYDAAFQKESPWLVPLKKGPFHALRVKPYHFTSYGGVVVDQYLRALDTNGKPITGLYVTGMDASGTYGDTYPVFTSGNAFGFSSWSGHAAVTQAIKDLKLK
ncbi:FAD-dependent oxidoreductase [Mesosutterella sp. AGMB02718]|uniref:FAD-dependent oxidoreductase n=1 Tax=Mesosutterella faecium TaxID=2925194 RepID=A0ABT7IP79_9BURK|nr:FAD-dependent oxidoreductase [Mesosutterella sp. AGMB02718]MDL2060187.1 FAD-dependent oxidoreductase [Mesosutterella sp. AGMB02718]